jgi:hypothetical protein
MRLRQITESNNGLKILKVERAAAKIADRRRPSLFPLEGRTAANAKAAQRFSVPNANCYTKFLSQNQATAADFFQNLSFSPKFSSKPRSNSLDERFGDFSSSALRRSRPYFSTAAFCSRS